MTLLRSPVRRSKSYLFPISLCLLVVGCSLSYIFGNVGTQFDKEKMRSPQQIHITERYGRSLRGVVNSTPILVLRGSYEEMGEAHGVLAGKDIIQSLDNVFISYANLQLANAWDSKILPTARAFVFPAAYESELAGIMQGIEKKYPNRQDRMLRSIGREITIDDLRALNCIIDIMFSADRCSSFSAWGSLTADGEVICGRNLDERYVPGRTPFMILARQPDELNRQATVDITSPGFIGAITACNADGLIFMEHDANGLETSVTQKWVPRAIVLRDAAESSRVGDSADKIASVFMNRLVRFGSNVHIARPANRVPAIRLPFVLEWDRNQRGNGVTVRFEDPSICREAIICTNHFLKRRPDDPDDLKSSHQRFKLMANQLLECRASKRVVGVEKAAKIMDSVARSGEWVTYLTVIAFPGEKKMIFATTPGNGISATRGEWTKLTWDQVFGSY
jgi:hypothetical protein